MFLSKLAAWMAATDEHKTAEGSFGSVTARVDYAEGAARIHLTDVVTIKPRTPVGQAADEVAALLKSLGAMLARGGEESFSVTIEITGAGTAINTAKISSTVSQNLVDGANRKL